MGQAFAGHVDFNNQQIANGLATVSFFGYITSSALAVDIAEDWQSEYLQFFLYVFATVWLVQRGSTESKQPGDKGRESDEEQQVGQYTPGGRAGAGPHGQCGTQRVCPLSGARHGGDLLGILAGAVHRRLQKWADVTYPSQFSGSRCCPIRCSLKAAKNRTLQNWQSEFLAVASIVVLSIYLRHRGSAQSKPVDARTSKQAWKADLSSHPAADHGLPSGG